MPLLIIALHAWEMVLIHIVIDIHAAIRIYQYTAMEQFLHTTVIYSH